MTSIESPSATPWSDWTPREVIAGTLVVLSVVIVFLLVHRFRLVAIIVFSGIIVNMAMTPAVDWLQRHHMPRALSVIVIYAALLGIFIGCVVLLIPPIIEQLSTALPKIETYYRDLKSALMSSPLLLIHQIAIRLPSQINVTFVAPPTTGDALDAVGQALTTTGAILSGLITLTAMLLIGFYWTLEGENVLRTVLRPLSTDKRESAQEIFQEIGSRVGGYVRGQGILAITIAVANLSVYLLIGLPVALAVALLAGACVLIPVIGPTLGMIPAVLVAFAYDPSKVIWVVVASTLIQLLENNLLAPRVMRITVGVNPLVTLLAIVAFGALFGFAGLLLAIPIAAIVQIILDRSLLRPQASGLAAPAGRDRSSKLRYDTQEYIVDLRNVARRPVTNHIPAEPEPVEDALEVIALELDEALAQVESSARTA